MDRSGRSERITGGAYIEALNELWKGNITGTVEKASLSIVDDPDNEHVFALYRLWIEALTQSGDEQALRELAEHLQSRGAEDPELNGTFTALRCLVHLELDEVGAARLFFRGISKLTRNHYVSEVAQIMADRGIGRPSSLLASHREAIRDYVLFTTMVRSHMQRGDEHEARRDVEKCESVFPGSPLPAIFEFHQAVEAGEFRQAGVHAANLHQNFPESSEYAFWTGYAHFRRNNLTEAVSSFERVARQVGDNDPDVASMIAYALRELARRNSSQPATHERATKALRHAVNVLKQTGLPVSGAALKLASLDQESAGEDNSPSLEEMSPTRIWLVRLSARRFHELMTAPERDIEYLTRAIGGQARSGDICFFAGDQQASWRGERRSKSRIWQIGAIYAVMTDPMWHPTSRHEHTLQLIARPPRGIPVDIHYLEERQNDRSTKKAPKDDASRFGTYEVGEGALTLITEAMTRQKHGLIGPEYEQEVYQLKRPS